MSSEDYQKDLESIVATLQDGQTIVRSKKCQIFRDNILTYYVTIDFKKLNTICAILDLQVRSTSPASNIASIQGKTISHHAVQGHPVVGFTVYGVPSGITAGGVTICTEAVAIGW